ncbi:MAG: hypothetical protein AB1505_32100 [Candidatus Latescibacterota bacterium]
MVSSHRAACGALAVLCVCSVAPPAARSAFEFAGEGARSLGQGGACVAGATAVEYLWHNPAANARAARLGLSATHARLYPGLDEDLNLSALSGVLPVGPGVLQAGVSSLGLEGWRERVAVLGYGWGPHARVALGSALWSVGWDAGRASHRAWRWDVGLTYEAGWVWRQAYLRLACVLENLTRANLAAGGQRAGQTPRQAVLGLSLDVEGGGFLVDVEVSGERTAVRAGYVSRVAALYGVELRLGGVGLPREWRGREVDVGLGRAWSRWRADYAFTYPLQLGGLGGTHWLSLGYGGD